MGQPNASRIQNIMRKLITSAENNDRQTVGSTTCFQRGDVVDILLVDALGCVSGVVASGLTVSGICPGEAFVFDSAIDTSAPPAGYSYYIENRNINDVQEILDRLCETYTEPQLYPYIIGPAITAQELNTPSAGQGRYTLQSDALCFAAGDTVQIICDEGIAGDGTVVSNDITNQYVVIDSSVDLTSFTNCKLINTSLTLAQIIGRLKDLIGTINIENECPGGEDCDNTVFETQQVMIEGSSKVYQDGVRLRLTDCGTRASLVDGTGSSELTFTSMVLGTRGNGISVALVDPLANNSPLSIAVTGNVNDGTKLITVSLETDGGGSIISTSQEVADALNADAEVKLLLQAQYGGDGTGVVATLASTNLASGANDYATAGDYCEIDQVSNNAIDGTGKKFISMWILPDEYQYANRKHSAPDDSEEICLDYRSSV